MRFSDTFKVDRFVKIDFDHIKQLILNISIIMKKITLLVAFLVAAFSYGQTSSGFVANPSFEDGSAAAIAGRCYA